MKSILVQLDTDAQPSLFDRVVAVDAGVDELFSYAGVTPDNVEGLVHGAIFTRAPKELRNTALFVGGSQAAAGDALLARILKTFFGPMRVSVLVDSNGSNTTAAAAVLAAQKHVALSGARFLVLGGTGPVGQRAAQILAAQGADVVLASRSRERAEAACTALRKAAPACRLAAAEVDGRRGLTEALAGAVGVIAAGAAGVELLPAADLAAASSLRVAIDLNAVPPAGIGGVNPAEKGTERNGVFCYGAIGVGGTKMKIHRACIQKLFERNDLILDTMAVYEVAASLPQ
jgi:hypothetical protein